MKKLIVAIVTPKIKGKLDVKSLAKLFRFLINNMVTEIIILGTTGEFNHMTFADKKKLLDKWFKIISNKNKPISCFIVISAKKMTETLKIINYCFKKKFDISGFLFAPLYGKGDLENKIKLVLKHTTIPIMLYNNPTIHNGLNIPIELIKKFKKNPKIMGIKDSSGNRTYFKSLLSLATSKFHIYQGSENNLIADLKNPKVTGIISGTANVVPRDFYNLVNGININIPQKNILKAKKQIAKFPNYIQGIKTLLNKKNIIDSAEIFKVT